MMRSPTQICLGDVSWKVVKIEVAKEYEEEEK